MKQRLNKNTREEQIIAFIGKYIEKNGYSPTNAEIAKSLKISLQQVFNLIKGLVEKGRIKKTGDRIRRLVVLKK